MNSIIRIAIAGDFCSSVPERIKPSMEISQLFKTTDFNILNFEGPLETEELCTANKTILKQSEKSAVWCKENGFKVVSLANNHSFDYGKSGLLKTINNLRENDITPVGAGKWEDAYKIEILKIKGIKIGIYAASSCDLATLKDTRYDKEKIGCAWINHPDTRRVIINSKKECDYLFVLPHAGVEFMDIPLPEWREIYKELIDLGADGIFASHPHVPQGVEIYKNKPIFYSLGNFFFEGHSKEMSFKYKYWDTGLIAIIEIQNNKISFSHVITQRKDNDLKIETREEIISHINYINNILNNDEKYDIILEQEVIKFHHKYKSWLLLGFNAYELKPTFKNIAKIIRGFIKCKPNERSALHQLREESTRWTIQRALKYKSKTQL